MRPEASDADGPAWARLGIRLDDLREADRVASGMRRSAAERRRALVTTGLPTIFAFLLVLLLAVVLASA